MYYHKINNIWKLNIVKKDIVLEKKQKCASVNINTNICCIHYVKDSVVLDIKKRKTNKDTSSFNCISPFFSLNLPFFFPAWEKKWKDGCLFLIFTRQKQVKFKIKVSRCTHRRSIAYRNWVRTQGHTSIHILQRN